MTTGRRLVSDYQLYALVSPVFALPSPSRGAGGTRAINQLGRKIESCRERRHLRFASSARPIGDSPQGIRRIGICCMAAAHTSRRYRYKERFAMLRKHPVLFGVVITACLAACGLAVIAHAHDDETPSTRQIAFAQDVSDLLVNEVVAALFKEFDETTPQNVEHGKQAISLIFNDVNRDIRLIGAFGPLLGGANDRPGDRFETHRAQTARSPARITPPCRRSTTPGTIAARFRSATRCTRIACSVTRISRPTSSTHTNNPGQWVGALVLGVPIRPSAESLTNVRRPARALRRRGSRPGDEVSRAETAWRAERPPLPLRRGRIGQRR